jgi:hypothetical protein
MNPSEAITPNELKRLFPGASLSCLKANQLDRVAPVAERQCRPGNESVAAPKGKGAYPGRSLVRVTSYRLRLCDERNLFDKYFIDSLVYAGLLRDDSPDEVVVEVRQEQVKNRTQERTVITIEPLAP